MKSWTYITDQQSYFLTSSTLVLFSPCDRRHCISTEEKNSHISDDVTCIRTERTYDVELLFAIAHHKILRYKLSRLKNNHLLLLLALVEVNQNGFSLYVGGQSVDRVEREIVVVVDGIPLVFQSMIDRMHF